MLHATKGRWITLALVLIVGFSTLGFFGREVYRQAPPIPTAVKTPGGATLFTKDDILDGQTVWQSIGGQEVGSIWGHGAYQAPDWSADWLHRECLALRDEIANERHGKAYVDIGDDDRAAIDAEVVREMRTNTFDRESGAIVVSERRARAMRTTAAHYEGVFGNDAAYGDLRRAYALGENPVKDTARITDLTRFLFWTSWACTTNRPNSAVSYTNNWPHEPLVRNAPTSSNVLWSIISVCLLILAVAALVFWMRSRPEEDDVVQSPARDPLDGFTMTPSMKAVGKYCVTVIALFLVQVLLGALTAHYTVEGQAFFGLPLADVLPYAISRTWHLQTAVFWIATSFLAAGLFLAPVIGGKEPKFQRLGVNVLFGALLVVVSGSLAGEWLAIRQKLGQSATFWFGHQGYEYVDLGRFWQIALFSGLLIWLALMVRGILPALRRAGEHRQMIMIFAASAAAIGLFYAAGFFYGQKSHLSVMEYWRWWVVHLWVEGFMEVFATAALGFLFMKFGLVSAKSTTRATLASTSIFLIGGIPGTFHHLYFSGTPTAIMAVGASFSALEVVPLCFVGAEALHTLKMEKAAPWMAKYKWPLRFFVGTAFWNLVGAGIFGFLINPPISLYYMQGLNTTPVHGHTALFGVYGLLALGLVLTVLRRYQPQEEWRNGLIGFAFWAMNIGLGLMVALSLLPIGLLQAGASIDEGLWFARSADFMQQPLIQNLRWMRMVGDTVFLLGVGSLVLFVVGLKTGWSLVRRKDESAAFVAVAKA